MKGFVQQSRLGALAMLLVVVAGVPSWARPAKDGQTFSLSAGQSVFWDGPHGPAPAGDPYSYQLRVNGLAYRLRIGIDRAEVGGEVYRVAITTPDGRSLADISTGAGRYSAEQLIERPYPGIWKIEVYPEAAAPYSDEVSPESRFRMRAKLEAAPPGVGTETGLVLPNLQVLPPHQPSFLLPVTNGSTDARPVGQSNPAESCHPEEHAEDGALRCLRFGFGVRNTGNGPLHLSLGPGAEFLDRDLIQRVERADGDPFERLAGIAKYHKTHLHYHHDAAIGLRLYRETDARGKSRLEAVGPMRTKGFAHREELLRDWDRFYPTWGPVPLGLRAGWADIYEWDRPGNYIDFGSNGDGHYVIRMWADPLDGILESNEEDNVAYAYLLIEGSAVELLEVGRGNDPWDRCKILVGPGGHPDPSKSHQPRRPAHCPRDTT